MVVLSRALFALERFDNALELTTGVLKKSPKFFSALLQHAAILACLDRMVEARDTVRSVTEVAPRFRVAHLKSFLLARDDAAVASVADALRRAGLPE